FHSGLRLVIHLRMTGRLVYYSFAAGTDKHTHGVFKFSDSSELHFHDVRKFATMWLVTSADINVIKGLCSLGPEPFAAEFSPKYLKEKCAASRRPVKNLLLSQETVAGIGNIYADEILFEAGIDPSRAGNSLSDKEIFSLWQSIKKVLSEGIAARGTSVRDYVDGAGSKGSYQHKLKVYGCEGKKCHLCGSLILRKKIAGRSSYYCSSCQG
ncbi:MAG TPA: DNA-formamidopyrimidine glycosylase, partial [Firmicutes bacterium]|nr:DNA-formamidopyrimidine glycosylase [Bacillota bacterium]